MGIRSLSLAMAGAVSLAAAPPLLAQDFPSRPIRVIVPFPPGGAMDSVVRLVSQEMGQGLNHPVIVENKPGAGTVIGVAAAARSAPDGYTLVVIATSFAANHTLVRNLPYDSLKDFRPVSLLTTAPHVLVGKPDLAARDLRELVALAKANPGKLSYASPGNGTGQHLGMETLKAAQGLDIVHIPYKGEDQALKDMLAGQVDLMVGNLPTALPHIRSGKLTVFGVGSRERSQLAPDIPTIREQGIEAFESTSWFGLVAPAGVPDAIVQRLNREVVRTLSLPGVKKALIARGFEPSPTSPEELQAIILAQIDRSARAIRTAKIHID
jgi:tripartite-type tricarboxylate transporter receptor subunit TctC